MIKYRPWLLSAAAVSAALILCVCLHNEISWILTAAGITLAAVFLFIFKKAEYITVNDFFVKVSSIISIGDIIKEINL